MAARVTETEVLAIMDTSLNEASITPYITTANVFVTGNLASSGLSDDILKEIERWLSAHFATISKERVSKEEGAGSAYIKYAGDFGIGLKSTQYGQTACVLDSSGTLENLASGGKQASIYVVPQFDE